MELIDNYNEAIYAIYDHVGFEEGCMVAPIDNQTDQFWNIGTEIVYHADSEEEFKTKQGNYYEEEIYKCYFYDKSVYVGEKFTMIICDSHVDGMVWFSLFDNAKKIC